jgi:hypothetical protein
VVRGERDRTQRDLKFILLLSTGGFDESVVRRKPFNSLLSSETPMLLSMMRIPEPKVRIHSAPAESQVQTCLSRGFAFLGREAAVFRGCPDRDERTRRAESANVDNVAAPARSARRRLPHTPHPTLSMALGS